MIQRDGVIGAQRGRVLPYHQRQLQPPAHFRQDGNAQLATAVGNHEVDRFGRHPFGRADEVPLVFAVFGVDNDHDPAGADSFYCFVNRGESTTHRSREPIIGC